MTPRSERRLRILLLLVGDRSSDLSSTRLCAGAAEAVGVSGAGVMLRAAEVAGATGCASDDVAATIEDLQFLLGEGPCVDAYEQSRPVLVPDLTDRGDHRWPAFAGAAVAAGARAVFGFPLQVGTARLGALDLYCAEPGPLSDGQHADALVAAELVAKVLLSMQANTPIGTVASQIESGGDFRYVVHQATGMVAAQLGVSVAQALVRLRAMAFATDRSITEVAGEVVARRLRFDADLAGPAPGG